MKKVDGLSKRLDLKVEVKNNNENQKLIEKKWIRKIMEVVVEGSKTMLVEKNRKNKSKR